MLRRVRSGLTDLALGSAATSSSRGDVDVLSEFAMAITLKPSTPGHPDAGSAVPISRRSPARRGSQIVRVLTTTDHKVIGKLYVGTAFAWFIAAGIMALVVRAELADPGNQFV